MKIKTTEMIRRLKNKFSLSQRMSIKNMPGFRKRQSNSTKIPSDKNAPLK